MTQIQLTMADSIPPPDVRALLPSLLACLPTAFASSQPPPALLPLLSPVLRQRVQLLSATAEKPTDSWLPLLCWQPGSAERLPGIVQGEAFELHPVSGELEYGEIDPIAYRRLDEETLQAKLELVDLGLVVVYTWVQVDGGENCNEWQVAEVSPLESRSEYATPDWSLSITAAEAKAKEVGVTRGLNQIVQQVNGASVDASPELGTGVEDNDDDYWAQYDKTPSRTPAATRSPLPDQTSITESRGRSASEAAYFEQYSQVQPEMDNDDPSEHDTGIGESSLNGNVVAGFMNHSSTSPLAGAGQNIDGLNSFLGPRDPSMSQPKASPLFTNPGAAPHLESPASAPPSASDTAIKQHVSTSIKSLFRLCRGAGIERREFEDLVRTELGTLELLNEDD